MYVHLFGGTCSPSRCNFVRRETAMEENKATYQPKTIGTVLRNFYVDSCLQSVEDEEQGVRLVAELRYLLQKGGFRLTKWMSNSLKVRKSVQEAYTAVDVKDVDLTAVELPSERVICVFWDVERDQFGYNISLMEKPLTRRGILSVVGSVYDH